MKYTPSKYQKAIYTAFQRTDKNLSISAVAGSGKTTVLLDLLNFVPKNASAIFLAFNNSIVGELKERVDRNDIRISTLHSCGWRAIMQAYGKVRMKENKVMAKVELLIKKYPEIEKRKSFYFYMIPKMVDLMRVNLCNCNADDIVKLADYYNVTIEEDDVRYIIDAFQLTLRDKKNFDFTDMIYAPVVDANVVLNKYEYVFCDESQDFSVCQHEFIKRCIARGGRLVSVGDERQSIYGFVGADANSYNKLADLNGKALKMPLSICYRCSKNVIREAQKVVPIIQYNETAPEGEVRDGSISEVRDGDWVICRNLKPLIDAYFYLIGKRIKATIKGCDIACGLIALIDQTGQETINEMMFELDNMLDRIVEKLVSRGIEHPYKHPKVDAFSQKKAVIVELSKGVNNTSELKRVINSIFSDKKTKGVVLSTIHKSKGLENERIFFLMPELIPSKFVTQDWELLQEENLRYVGITRAKRDLIYISESDFKSDIQK